MLNKLKNTLFAERWLTPRFTVGLTLIFRCDYLLYNKKVINGFGCGDFAVMTQCHPY